MKKDINLEDENGRPHGYWEAYWYNGQLRYKGCYIHGKRHGYFEEYFDNGQLAYKGCYNHGKRHGYWLEYNYKGWLLEEGFYINGFNRGIWKFYNNIYDNGKIFDYYSDKRKVTELYQTSNNKFLI